MNPDEIQNMTPAMASEMSPDDAMAALAISTRLSEQMMMQQAPQDMPVEGEFGAEMPPEGTETPETEETAPTEETPVETQEIEEEKPDPTEVVEEKMEEVKTEMKDTIKTEIKSAMDGFKKMIENAIKD
jgi:hypothetical protein